MIIEPFIVEKVEGIFLEEDRASWIRSQSNKAALKGIRHARVTAREAVVGGFDLLFEGWLKRPEEEGRPRWER